jgi:hypothetical protein
MLSRLPWRQLTFELKRPYQTTHQASVHLTKRKTTPYYAGSVYLQSYRMASTEAPKKDAKVAEASSAPAPAENGDINLVPGPDGTMMSKSAAKKAQKELEKQARAAAKETLKAQRTENLSAVGTGKKEKVKKEVKEEPKWVNNTTPGEKKGESSIK